MQTLTIEDRTVFHAPAQGTAHGTVLFVHGYFVDGSVWNEWLAFFAARGVDAYAVNLRGRAGSKPGTHLGRVSIDEFADDASVVARELAPTAVVGHSMGGLVAQKLAERNVVRAAVLLTPAPPKGISVLSPRLAWLQLRYLPAILLNREVHPGREDLREVVMNRVPEHLQDELLSRMLPDSGRAGRDMSIRGVPVDASKVRCPMLVVAARDDKFIPAPIVERVATRYAATLRVAEHHGHMLIVEPGWEAIAADVEQWLREHS